MSAVNLSELFSQRIFRIPDYQRGYAWGNKQLSEFWDDLDEIHMKEDGELRQHYTGTLYLEESKPAEEEKWLPGVKFYDVVDGQQRLTTVSILVFELLKVTQSGYCEESRDDLLKKFIVRANATGASRVYKFGYARTSDNANYFLGNIMEDSTVIVRSDGTNLYTKNLDYAKSFFRDRVSVLSKEDLDVLFRKISTSLQFDIRTIECDLDVQAVFETMNNRGKPLSILEKLKNRLIYLTEKLRVGREDRQNLRIKINESWGKVFACLAKNENSVLDEDTFLSAHLSLYRRPKESVFSEHSTEEKVFQMFCNKSEKYFLNFQESSGPMEDSVSFKKIEEYVLSLAKLAPIWYLVHNSDSKLMAKVLVQNSSKDIKIFLAAVLLQSKTSIERDSILVELEKVLFRNRISGIGVIDERTFASWARELYWSEDTIDGVLNACKDLLSTTINPVVIVEYFQALFRYSNTPKGFHKWGNLKYFLFEYEEWLQKEALEEDAKVTLSDFDETTIEHIIPQNYWDHWKNEVSEVIDGILDAQEKGQAIKVLLNTLGNLTILKGGKNSSLGNRPWIEKKNRFRTGSYNEIDIANNLRWRRSEIYNRGLKMLNFLEVKLPGLDFSSDQKESSLFYDNTILEKIRAEI